MAEKPPGRIKNVILVWVVGLTLGIGAGALTAMLLLPSEGGTPVAGESLGDRMRRD